MKKWRKQALLVGSLLLFLTGCSGKEQEIQAPALLDPVGVQGNLEVVQSRELYHLNYAEGEVIAYLEPIYFSKNAVIMSMNVSLGDHVKKGDTLGEIFYADVEVQDISTTTDEYENGINACQQRIVEIDALINQGGLDSYDKRYQQLLLSQEKEKLSRLKEEQEAFLASITVNTSDVIPIIAPIEGDIAAMADLPQNLLVKANKSILVIADCTQKIVACDLATLGVVTGEYEDYILLDGVETKLQPYTSKSKETLLFTLENSDALTVGDGILVFRKSDYRSSAVSISNDLIYSDDDGKYVYVKENGEKVRRNIMIGNIYTTYTEVLDGLQEGDEVYVQN